MHAISAGREMVRLRARERSPFFPQSAPALPFVLSGLKFAARSQYRRRRAVPPLSDRGINLFDLKSRIAIEVFHVD